MKRIAALVVAGIMLLVIVLPAFADPAGEFSPGDNPPAATPADGGQATAIAATSAAGAAACLACPGSPGNSGTTPAPTAGPKKP